MTADLPTERDASLRRSRRRLAFHVVVHAACAALAISLLATAQLASFSAIVLLALVAGVAELFPVPFPGKPDSYASLAAVFVLAAATLYGAPTAMIVGFCGVGAGRLLHRQVLRGAAFNASVGALSGGISALVAGEVVDALVLSGVPADVLLALVASLVFWLVNNLLMAVVFVINEGERFREVAFELLREELVLLVAVASTVCMLETLWQRTPLLILTLIGPLVVIVLYQRSLGSAFEAMQLARTDALTGLGNRRAFRERLDAVLDEADRTSQHVALCFIDVDDFKDVNDRLGHASGDRLLEDLASCLRVGEAFRIGGDEFAVLIEDRDLGAAHSTAQEIIARVEQIGVAGASVSIGLALHDGHRDSLMRRADAALYEAKRAGKSVVRVAPAEHALRAA